MSGNTFGTLFRVTTWGESHGPAVGCVIDGCPPRIPVATDLIQEALDKRKPGQGAASTTRNEADRCEILSGVLEGLTTGMPISIIVRNKDHKSSAYDAIKDKFRPGHGDYSWQKRYGIRDWRGGGRSSGRETIGRVAAGAVAQQVLDTIGVKVVAETVSLGGIEIEKRVEGHAATDPFYCPDPDASKRMLKVVNEAKAAGDSVGGIVEVRMENLPAGLGEPVFSKFDADLASALMGIGSVKGVEIGSGFSAAGSKGSLNNDGILPDGFESNHAGGILGGVTSGQTVVARIAAKPVSSITIPQNTINKAGEAVSIVTEGRHDVSVIPRIHAVAISMARIVCVDHLLRWRAIS